MIAPLLLSAAISAQEGWQTVEATAYCPCAICCDARTERTADGTDTDLVPHGVAASPNIPLGWRVYVPYGDGYLDESVPFHRWFPIDDRGGALRSDQQRSGVTRLDLRYRTHESAQRFGRKTIVVYFSAPKTKENK